MIKSSRFLFIQMFTVTKSIINMIKVQDTYHTLAKWKASNLFITLIILKRRVQGEISCESSEQMGIDSETDIEK